MNSPGGTTWPEAKVELPPANTERVKHSEFDCSRCET